MSWNLLMITLNMNPVFWGASSVIAFLGLTSWCKSLLSRRLQGDVLFFGFVNFLAVLLVMLLSFFREPLRFGMNDSMNRILFQICPLSLLVATQYWHEITGIFKKVLKQFGGSLR